MTTRRGAAAAAARDAVAGVQLIPLPVMADHRGAVYRMLRCTDPHFERFGEIYFSSIHPGVVKAWKRHRSATVNYACVQGRIRMVLFDDRAGSPSRGAVQEVLLGPDSHHLLVVPPGVWNGFQGVSATTALLANCATEPHDEGEFDRLDPLSTDIPYAWPAAGATK